MNITALEEYGLRIALRLARLKDTEHLSASKIAELEGISVEYVGKFMTLFRKSELVRTVRGVQGGFALSRRPAFISIFHLFESLQGRKRFSVEFCEQYSGRHPVCVHTTACSVKPFWSELSKHVDAFTKSVSLEDVAKQSFNSSNEIIRNVIPQNLYSARPAPAESAQGTHS